MSHSLIPPSASSQLTGAMQAITEVIIKALEAPLRAQVEACIQAIVAEATQDIHARIAAAVGQIQPINIPINLFTQPVLAPIAPIAPIASPLPQAVPVVQAAALVPPPESEPEPEPESAPAPMVQIAPLKPSPAHLRAPAPLSSALAKKALNITVVGLKPGQAHMIKSEFKFIKLRFITSDAGAGKQLKSLAKTNDYVVQMTDFIRHAVGESVKSVSGNWIYISGGMTKLRDKLEELNSAHKSQISPPCTA